jgi:hypothetical protein
MLIFIKIVEGESMGTKPLKLPLIKVFDTSDMCAIFKSEVPIL